MTTLPHFSWDLSPKEAIEYQKSLRNKVRLTGLSVSTKRIAGVDVSYEKGSKIFYAGIVVLKYETMELVEEVTAAGRVTFPYVPGLLSFREGPVVVKAFEKLKVLPDLLIFDGQGIAHPRGVGLASHMGLALNVPSIGCAKSRLCGEYDEPGFEKGSYSPLVIEDREVGVVLRTREGIKPLFVSPGHLIDIRDSMDIVLKCCLRYRLPEPTRQAHLLVNRVRKSGLSS